MSERVYNVLFLCTGNSARSILAEAVLNHRWGRRFRAFSAGSHPTGTVNPGALELLGQLGIAADGLRSKSWDEFAQPGSPRMDFVMTVCDNAAAEVCPLWPGQPITAHWGVADPAAVTDPNARAQAFRQTVQLLSRRIELFVQLPLASLDNMSLARQLQDIDRLSQ